MMDAAVTLDAGETGSIKATLNARRVTPRWQDMPLNGEVHVQSEAGRGSTFSFTAMLQRADEQAAHRPSADATGPRFSIAHAPAVLLAESESVAAGGTARFLVASGLKDQVMVLDVFRDGKRVDRRVLRAGKDSPLVELPVKREDRGGFSVALQVVRDYQLMRFEKNVFVPRDDKELKVEF